MNEYIIVYPPKRRAVQEEVTIIRIEHKGNAPFDELEKRLNKHPLIRYFDRISSDDNKIVGFYKGEMGCAVYEVKNGSLIQL